MPRLGPLALKIQLYVGEERALGPGRADVLAAIEREGSISGAGRSLGMSYRFTWLLVNSMNNAFREKLVEASPGGSKGGRAMLTEAGKEVLSAYRELENQLVRNAEGKALAVLTTLLRDSDAPKLSASEAGGFLHPDVQS
jgi:molybdate transport system regulatory protein